MLLDGLFKGNQTQQMRETAFFNNTIPIFNQFGRNVYASDVVQMCIDCIASECSKLQPRHIRRNPDTGNLIRLQSDNINRLFKFRPNPLMTTKDFLEKTTWQLYLSYNAWIYPAYDVNTDARGNKYRTYTGFWPLQPIQVEWLEDLTNTLFIKLTFGGGKQFTLPYSDLVHLRKKYSINDVMGGGDTGMPDNQALLSTLQINNTILQGIANGVKMSAGIHGVMKVNTTIDEDKKDAERTAFMNQVSTGEGVLMQDFKGEFIPVTINPAVIDATTLSFIENKILRWYGVSLPILNGTYTDDEYQAFYNKTLEPIVIALGQAFSDILFSQNEQAFGNEIVFYQQKLELMDVKNKIAIMDGLGNRGALSNNQLLALFGIEPYEGGDVHMASLNYINAALMDQYQLARAGHGDINIPEGGKTNNEK